MSMTIRFEVILWT